MSSSPPRPAITVPLTLIDDDGTRDVLITGTPDAPVQPALAQLPADWQLGTDLLAGSVLDLRAPTPASPGAPAGLVAEVVAGPDAGRRIPLAAGRHVLGREVVMDPALSRHHAELAVAPAAVLVRDAGSTNGTVLADPATEVGVPTGHGLRWEVGQELRAGSTRIALRRRPAIPAPQPDDGRIRFARSPRRMAEPAAREFDLPRPVPTPARPTFPMLAVWAPLALALPMAWFMHSPMWILFGLLSPVMMLANHVEARRRGQVVGRAARARTALRRATTLAAVQEAIRAEQQWREVAFPDAAELFHQAASRGPGLWERGLDDPDALTVRLGIGQVPSRHVLLSSTGRAPLQIPDTPLTLSLVQNPVVGVVGPDGRGVVTAMLAQLICLHSPTGLRITVIGDDPALDWLRWAPHRDPGSQIAAPDESERLVVVITDPHIPAAQTLADLPERVSVIVCGTDRADLPGEASCVVTTGPHPTVEHRDSPSHPVQVDQVSAAVAEQVARSLTPVQDVTPTGRAGTLPTAIGLAQVLGLELGEPDRLVDQIDAHWQDPATEATLGVGGTGTWTVDLKRDGPHLLVAGTTGSGKSELLRTLVTSLAIANRPDELSFILVDYKGGAAFGACARLPHVTGLVTDLDHAGTARVIESLATEIKYREGLLAQAGVADLGEYRRRGTGPVLPRLAIVLDEFRVLADEQPEALADLVRLATVGRSLGLHLVLATQRPAGVVTAEMNANINLRIALRVQSPAESTDVIGFPGAAALPTGTPGRALVRIGGDTPVTVQVASVSGGGLAPAQVRCEPWQWRDPQTEAPATGPQDDANLHCLVDAIGRAATRAGIDPVAPAWLPPLPTEIDLPAPRDLLVQDDASPEAGLRLALGRGDEPARRNQPHTWWDPMADGHLIVAGTARSGRTSVLRTLLLDGLARFTPDRLWVYAIDSGGGLGDLAQAAHVGAVVSVEDDERLARLLGFLRREIAERAAGHTRPHIVLAIDSWEGLRTGRDDVEGLALMDDLFGVLRDGPRAGVFVVVAGGRATLTGQLATAIALRLLLRPADPTDLTLAGLRTRDAPSPWPAGRGLLTGRTAHPEPLLVQTYRPPSGVPGPGEMHPEGAHPIPALPSQVSLEEVATDGMLVLGLGGEQVHPVSVDLSGSPLLIAGHPGSGRTTALRTLATQAVRDGWQVVSSIDLPGAQCPQDLDRLREAVAGERILLVIDDAERLPAHWEHCLTDALAARSRPGAPAIVVAGSTPALTTSFSGPLVELRRDAAVLLLGPAMRADNDLVDLRLPSRYTRHPGRGVLVHRGRTTQVQVAR